MSLEDVEAIKQLKARYFRCMDTKAWDELTDVFAPDVRIDMADEGGGTHTDRDTYMAMLVPILADVVTVHHGHMPEITLTSPTTATGIWAMEDELWFPEGSPISHLHGYGHYHETYTKAADGTWRIASMTLTRLRRDFTFPDAATPSPG